MILSFAIGFICGIISLWVYINTKQLKPKMGNQNNSEFTKVIKTSQKENKQQKDMQHWLEERGKDMYP
jgi:hypothetical protein